MSNLLDDLIVAIVSYVTEHDSYVTKTKLLKLLYLFDVEFYRVHRTLFTGFQWKYFHLGPWTGEFDPILAELVARDLLLESSSKKTDFDTKFYRATESIDIGKLFSSFSDEGILKGVLRTWGGCSTGEILDYVYFRTEPMEAGVRSQPLDFTRISAVQPARYVKTRSEKTRRDIGEARRALEERLRDKGMGQANKFAFTPPRYDAEYLQAIEKLDNGE